MNDLEEAREAPLNIADELELDSHGRPWEAPHECYDVLDCHDDLAAQNARLRAALEQMACDCIDGIAAGCYLHDSDAFRDLVHKHNPQATKLMRARAALDEIEASFAALSEEERIATLLIASRNSSIRLDNLERQNAQLLAALEALYQLLGEALIESDHWTSEAWAEAEAEHHKARAAIAAATEGGN